MKTKLLVTSFAVAAAIWVTDIGITFQDESIGFIPAVTFGAEEAKAQNAARNTARRTSRRTTRRVNRRQSIAGCTPYNAYYNCGGVYYRPVVENGVTVYVVVNP